MMVHGSPKVRNLSCLLIFKVFQILDKKGSLLTLFSGIKPAISKSFCWFEKQSWLVCGLLRWPPNVGVGSWSFKGTEPQCARSFTCLPHVAAGTTEFSESNGFFAK